VRDKGTGMGKEALGTRDEEKRMTGEGCGLRGMYNEKADGA